MKKFISVVLIATLICTVKYNQTFSNDSVSVLESYDLSSCYEEICVDLDNKSVSVDGQSSTLSDVLNISESKELSLLDNKDSLENFCKSKGYVYESVNDQFIIQDPFQTKRILVYTNELLDDYDAISSSYYFGAYTLEYDTKDATQKAYYNLISDYGEESVILDKVFNLYSTWQDNCENEDFYQHFPNVRTNTYSLIKDINAYQGTKNEIVVGVIDSGMDTDTLFYSDRYLTESCVSFVKETTTDSDSVEDLIEHGSSVCFALANSSPDNVKIIVYKVFDSQGNSSHSAVRNALIQAYNDDVDIINMSFGGISYTEEWSELKTLYEKGVTIIAAAGNDGSANADNIYPANSPYTVAVSAISNTLSDGKYSLADYTSYGSCIDFSSPGTKLCLANITEGLSYYSGTSYAAPIISGQLAMLKTFIDTSTVYQDINLLRTYISDDFLDDYRANPHYKSQEYGYGYLDLSGIEICSCGSDHCKVLYHDEVETTTESNNSSELFTTSSSIDNMTFVEDHTTTVFAETDTTSDFAKTETTSNLAEIEITSNVGETDKTSNFIESITTTGFADDITIGSNVNNNNIITESSSIHDNIVANSFDKSLVKLPKNIRLKIKKKSVTLKYRKRNKKDKIIIQYSKNRKFKTYKKFITSNRNRYKFKIKKKGKYFVRLRCYRIIKEKKYYSKYSKVRKIRIK